MKNRIPDTKIKGYIRDFKSGEERSYSLIVSMISQYIYNYPRIVFSSDVDACGDFYEYMLRRLRNIINAYRETEAKFLTWFTVVLRNRYLNFLREKRSKYIAKENINLVSFDYQTERFQGLYNVVGDTRDYGSSGERDYSELVDTIVKNLRDKQRLYFHLYYIDTLRPEDLGFLAVYIGLGFREVLFGIDRIKGSLIEKYEIKRSILQKLTALFYRIMRCQREGDEKQAGELKKKRDNLLREYRRVKLNPSYKNISNFLKLPQGTVSAGILRMKQSVKQILKEHHYEEMPF
jgi:RNA polymerase sigma factor (sigma-70 family)